VAKQTAFEKTKSFAHFKDVARRLVAVPKSELDEQLRLHEKQSKASGSRPGPKPKKKTRARKPAA